MHVRSDDRDDFYQVEAPWSPMPGLSEARLRCSRASGHWLACLNGATAVREPQGSLDCERDVARRALDAAAAALIVRATKDREFLLALFPEV